MPRPTAAQLVYGSATVVVSTIAMLLLSQTSSGIGVAVICVAALALGLLIAASGPIPARRSRPEPAGDEQGVSAPLPQAGAHAPAAARVTDPRTAAAEHPVHH